MAVPCLDARQCYDRMAHNMLSLSLQRLGVPLQPIRSLLEVLKEAHHRPLTAYGPSSLTFPDRSQQGLDPLMGPGQGNGMAPMGYGVFLSAAIVTMLKEENLQSSFNSAISNRSLDLVCGVMFVDDADLFVTPIPASSARYGLPQPDPILCQSLVRRSSCHRWSHSQGKIPLVPPQVRHL